MRRGRSPSASIARSEIAARFATPLIKPSPFSPPSGCRTSISLAVAPAEEYPPSRSSCARRHADERLALQRNDVGDLAGSMTPEPRLASRGRAVVSQAMADPVADSLLEYRKAFPALEECVHFIS